MVLWGLAAVSCKQDDVFNKIASETAPIKPRIEGAPTNMVVFERNGVSVMYVAAGQLHWYAKAPDGTPQWDLGDYAIPQPAGKIISLAVAGDRLYALCRDGNGINATLQYIGSNGNEWKPINSPTAEIQSIYAANTQLFAGAGTGTYAIYYLDNDDTLKMLKSDTLIFSGAACKDGIYYLSTRGDGIFQISETDLAAGVINDTVIPLADNTGIDEKNKRMFMSMIKLEDDTIIAVERDGGSLYEINNGSFTRMHYESGDTDWINIGKYATEALTLWKEIDPESQDITKRLFIVGIQGGLYSTTTSSHTYGYVEFDLINSDGSFDKTSRRRDAGNLLSVADQDRYMASMGTHPVNHLFQAPEDIDPNMTFFASTQNAGLWSYRDRPNNGGPQWNAEE